MIEPADEEPKAPQCALCQDVILSHLVEFTWTENTGSESLCHNCANAIYEQKKGNELKESRVLTSFMNHREWYRKKLNIRTNG